MPWPDTRLTELFGIDHPIVQAPMLGSSTPELAAAVSNAGGLGSMGCGNLPVERVRETFEAVRSRTNAPFNLNFFLVGEPPEPDPDAMAALRARLQPWYDRFGLGPVPDVPPAPGSAFDAEMVETLAALRPAVVSVHFAPPPLDAVERLQAAGIRVAASATTVAEGRTLDALGLDAIIAQGWEAGGHRGSFARNGAQDGVGTMALVPQMADAVRAPVIAAGGIGDGRGIAAALALGAAGVQIGTGFLSTPEAATDHRRRALLRAAGEAETMVTDAVSGRMARGARSAYAADMAAFGGEMAPYLAMYGLSQPLLDAARAAGDDSVHFLLYGQGAGLNREEPAAELLERLVAEAQAAIRRLAG